MHSDKKQKQPDEHAKEPFREHADKNAENRVNEQISESASKPTEDAATDMGHQEVRHDSC